MQMSNGHKCQRVFVAATMHLVTRAPADTQVKLSKPLAWWIFVRPDKIKEVDEWIKAHTVHTEGLKGRPSLTKKELGALKKSIGEGVVYIYQHAGQGVHVPVGWMHYVRNLQPCVKMAFDKYVPANFALYIRTWHQFCSPVMGCPLSAKDYMAAQDVLVASAVLHGQL
jgi:hypothetical protein